VRVGGHGIGSIYSANADAKMRVGITLAAPIVAFVVLGAIYLLTLHSLPVFGMFVAIWFVLTLWVLRVHDSIWRTAWSVWITDDDVMHARSWPIPHRWDIPIRTITLITAPGPMKRARPYYEIAHWKGRLRVTRELEHIDGLVRTLQARNPEIDIYVRGDDDEGRL